MYICLCNAITERQLRECARDGACCIDELAAKLGVGAGCGRCLQYALEVLEEVKGMSANGATSAEAG